MFFLCSKHPKISDRKSFQKSWKDGAKFTCEYTYSCDAKNIEKYIKEKSFLSKLPCYTTDDAIDDSISYGGLRFARLDYYLLDNKTLKKLKTYADKVHTKIKSGI
jgi:hypothetical protein